MILDCYILIIIIIVVIIVVLIECGGNVDNLDFLPLFTRKIKEKTHFLKRWTTTIFLVDNKVEKMCTSG